MRAKAACATAVLTAAVSAAASGTAQATPCLPTVYGYGPTVTVTPDYSNPAGTGVDYDSSDFEVGVTPCPQ